MHLNEVLSVPHVTYFAKFSNNQFFDEIVETALNTIWLEFEDFLLMELHANRVDGAYAEFGIWKGNRLGRHHARAKARNDQRLFIGFDSFEGLSEPDPEKDVAFFKKGMFRESYESVCKNLDISNHKNIKLVKGWVAETLKEPNVKEFDPFAFVLIDTDIYEPCVDILDYLETHLIHNGILAFDDWTYDIHLGETRAFVEFLEKSKKWTFELVAAIHYRVYFRVIENNNSAKLEPLKNFQTLDIKNSINNVIWNQLGIK